MQPRRKGWLAVGILAVGGTGAVLLLPGNEASIGYPFAEVAPDGVRSPLWRLEGEAFEQLAADDSARLARFTSALDAGVARAEADRALLASERADDVTAAQRQRIRDLWYGVLEPTIALESLKERWAPWYGIDYRHHPARHSRAFALAFGALLAQVDAGLRFVALTQGHAVVETLLDEPVPELGLPSKTYAGFKFKVLHVKRYAEVVTGFDWYRLWLGRHLRGDRGARALDGFVRARHAEALRRMAKTGAVELAKNAGDLLRDHAFEQWLPVQTGVASWMGDTRFVPQERRLIKDEHLAKALTLLQPGDILVERRNWYLSNVGLPGFWPHAALYFGTPEEIARLGEDPEVRAAVGPLPETFASRYPAAWRALVEPADGGHPRRVIEAVSEGVVFQSFEHSCGADYVAALRPRISKVAVARALERALQLFGRPYDFDFDFTSDASVVCSELVQKCYDQPGGLPGLTFPFIDTVGRRTLPPTEIVRTFARERGREDRQLDFVFFFDGREARHAAIEASADDLAASADRAKWDLAQP